MNRQFLVAKAKPEHGVNDFRPILRALLYAGALVAIITVLLVPALALEWIKPDMLSPVFLYGNYAAIFLGALIAAYLMKGKGWLTGLILLLSICWLPLYWQPSGKSRAVRKYSFVRLLIAFCLGSLGGMIGVNL